ncbi:helix-turn-helix domain-containing protein [bacterium]|nr:helix-turn-helix domain-containing protein [bacterium]
MYKKPKIEQLYSLEDIAKLLRLSKKTVYNKWKLWKAEGRIKKVYRVGGVWRFPEPTIRGLIDSFEM